MITPSRRSGWVTFAAAAVLPFILFTLTMPTDLTWSFGSADGAELMTAAATLGVPHPPGYPTFTLLGHLLIRLPLPLAIPLRFHLLSAASISAACGFIALAARHYFPYLTGPTAIVIGLLAGTSSWVWQQAVVAEVYGLNAMFVALLLWLIATRQRPLLVGLAVGLAVTTHLTSLFLLPLALVSISGHQWGKLGVGLVLGSLPWGAIPLLAASGSPVVWGEPTTVSGWLWLITGQLYRPNVFGISADDLAGRLIDWLPELTGQLAATWIAAPWFAVWWRVKRKRTSLTWGRYPWWATAGLYVCYAFGYRAADAFVLMLPAVLITAVEVAPFVQKLKEYGILLPLLMIGLNLGGIIDAKSSNVRHSSLDLLNSLPNKTLVITDGQDQTIFTVWYFHHVEGVRPDLAIVDENLLAFDWYRRQLVRSSTINIPLEEDNLRHLLDEEKKRRPVCRLSLRPVQANCLEDETK